MKEFLKEYLEFLRTRKAYWIVPLLVVLLALGALLFFAQSSAMAPFIYTLF